MLRANRTPVSLTVKELANYGKRLRRQSYAWNRLREGLKSLSSTGDSEDAITLPQGVTLPENPMDLSVYYPEDSIRHSWHTTKV